ncbi:Spermatogenesis-associated protein 2-like protein [Merluccius polli]|uniref:Spermatogenesis-associated protein 2-like protein n=1 Tax=Merluccius polli TaxID=89951 RepID=A0AA47M269_MERPO|nr:Spermatogenesis-associated protein 2-like protein [Merluccius polli]
MSVHFQITKDLVKNYDHCLEQRLVEGASSLTCDDEVLRKHVEGILETGCAEDMHSLGLDPLKVMEESLKATAALPASAAGPRRGGLRGLAKAFEVLEQAALNLYLSPWREEYKVVKMYSGIFTHCIKPVLSTAQIAKLFGLLGYQPCSGQQEQLQRGRSGVHSTSPTHLLQLSCGFFLARCECQLLLAALGNHAGEAEWELDLVMERRRGHSLQVALDNSKKLLETNQALPEDASEVCVAVGELELDLYTEGLKSGRRETSGFQDDHGGPRSLFMGGQSSIHLTQSNGLSTPSSSSTTAAAATATSPRVREPRCVTTINCQLSKTSPPRQIPSGATRTAATTQAAAAPDEDLQSHGFDRNEDRPSIAMAQASGLTNLEASLPPSLEHLCSCSTSHNASCPSLHKCNVNRHRVAYKTSEEKKNRPPSSQGLRETGWCMPPSHKDDADMSLLLCNTPESIAKPPQPITYHSCCDQALEPHYVCFTCDVFHSGACTEGRACTKSHNTKLLQVCHCGVACSRNPLVLCRYCGREYCSQCWYRNPVTCACGKTFDHQSMD